MVGPYAKIATNQRQDNTTPQTQPIPEREPEMAKNSAGGFTFTIGPWGRLDRFLILGTPGNTYYVSAETLGTENAENVIALLREDGMGVLRRVREVSDRGLAPKNTPAIYVLALAASLGGAKPTPADLETRYGAFAILPEVARYSTDLYHFAALLTTMRGTGMGMRKGLGRWYAGKTDMQLAYQFVKYQSRDGWSHRDILRLCRPFAGEYIGSRRDLFYWVERGWESIGADQPGDKALRLVWAMEKAKRAKTAPEVARIVRDFGLPWEAVPTAFRSGDKANREVWEALIPNLGLTAIIRNLPTLTRAGILDSSIWRRAIVSALTDPNEIARSRVHPIRYLIASLVYQSGKSRQGSAVWTPNRQAIDALDAGFYAAFGNVPASARPATLGIDVSGSMDKGEIGGVAGLTPRIAAAAMALVTMQANPDSRAVVFRSRTRKVWTRELHVTQGPDDLEGCEEIDISPRQRLDDVIRRMERYHIGGTDAALPMLWARKHARETGGFAVYTDNETWAGHVHPSQALELYRRETGIPARFAAVAFTATEFSVADPQDPNAMNVVGFDASTPAVLASFLGGDLG